jgi:TetR/AcrR family transcriptional regulator
MVPSPHSQATASSSVGAEANTHGPTAQQLVQVAIQAFASHGYDGVSLRDVERRAQLNRGLVAYHFGSKEQLWKICVDWLMDRFHAEMTSYRDVLWMVSPAERERLLLKIYTRFVAKNPEFFRILVAEGSSCSPRSELLATRLRATLDFFDEVADRKDDFRRPEDAAMSYYLFVGAASVLFAVPAQCKYLFGVEPDDSLLERFSDLVVDIGVNIRRHPSFQVSPGDVPESSVDTSE